MRLHYVLNARRGNTTGHYCRPGTKTLYCGRPAGGYVGHLTLDLVAFTVCIRCTRASRADRDAA